MTAPSTTVELGTMFKGLTLRHLESEFGIYEIDAGIVIPYRDIDGTLLFEKLIPRSGGPRFLIPPGTRVAPYGLETLKFGGPIVILVEGESCAWEVRSAFPRTPVLGVPGASSWKESWASYLFDFPVIYLSFDGDSAGDRLLDFVWPTLPWARRVKLPRGMDTRDVLQVGGGVSVFEKLLAEADFIAGFTRLILEKAAGR